MPHLFSICRDYMEISGSLLNEEKSVCLIMGSAKAETPPEDITMKWVRYGEEAMPSKYLGVKFAMSGGIGEQWESLRDKLRPKWAPRREIPLSLRPFWVIKVQPPGIEPGSPAWRARILPLDHGCCFMLIWASSIITILGAYEFLRASHALRYGTRSRPHANHLDTRFVRLSTHCPPRGFRPTTTSERPTGGIT